MRRAHRGPGIKIDLAIVINNNNIQILKGFNLFYWAIFEESKFRHGLKKLPPPDGPSASFTGELVDKDIMEKILRYIDKIEE